MTKEEVLKLAQLARIEISDEEAESLTHEFEAILEYVGQVKGVADNSKFKIQNSKSSSQNVMREDEGVHKAGEYTEDLLKEAPDREGDYVKVKQILG